MSNSPAYYQSFRKNGLAIGTIRQQLVDYAQHEHDMEKIDQYAQHLISQAGGQPAFKKVPGYHWSTCICVNDCLVHGIPQGTFKQGDLVTIDVGMYLQGTTTDVATTFVIGQATKEQQQFLAVGQKTMRKAIRQAQPGNKVKQISQVLQRIPEAAGYSVTRHLVGHGLGKTMHEPPSIPCFVSNDPAMDVILEPGMVITIEAMYMAGDWPLIKAKDGWGLFTKDGSIAAMFEEDILITKDGPEIISLPSVVEN